MVVGQEIIEEAVKIYENDPEIREGTKNASIVEAMGYAEWPRLKDTIKYAQLMGYKRLGIVYCVGLIEEAKRAQDDYIVGRFISSGLFSRYLQSIEESKASK